MMGADAKRLKLQLFTQAQNNTTPHNKRIINQRMHDE